MFTGALSGLVRDRATALRLHMEQLEARLDELRTRRKSVKPGRSWVCVAFLGAPAFTAGLLTWILHPSSDLSLVFLAVMVLLWWLFVGVVVSQAIADPGLPQRAAAVVLGVMSFVPAGAALSARWESWAIVIALAFSVPGIWLLFTASWPNRIPWPGWLTGIALNRVISRLKAAQRTTEQRMELDKSMNDGAVGLLHDRLADPVASGVISHTSAAALHELGDLLDDETEITVPERKQSRRGIRLHRTTLCSDEVTIVDGLPVTTHARTVADLLRDGHDPSHIAEIAGDALGRNLASRHDIATALEPLARRNGQPSGAALLEHLLDLVGLSGTALVKNLATSELGKSLVAAGHLSAIANILEAVSKLDIPKNALEVLNSEAIERLTKNIELRSLPEDILPKLDMSAIIAAAKFSVPIDNGEFQKALSASVTAAQKHLVDDARGHGEDTHPHLLVSS